MAYWKTVSPFLGLKVEDEEGFQDFLGHRPGCLGKESRICWWRSRLGSGIKVAGNITAIVALEGLQAHPTKG